MSNDADLLPHLSHSRLQKYITCPEQYRLYYLERLRPKHEAAARVFGAVMHLALAEYFRREQDPLATFAQEWGTCQKFGLRYSQRENWKKLSEIGEALLSKFLAQEAHKFEQCSRWKPSSRSVPQTLRHHWWERSISWHNLKAENSGRIQDRGCRKRRKTRLV
jgi:PD-(D/E)XK nuclease superfamily